MNTKWRTKKKRQKNDFATFIQIPELHMSKSFAHIHNKLFAMWNVKCGLMWMDYMFHRYGLTNCVNRKLFQTLLLKIWRFKQCRDSHCNDCIREVVCMQRMSSVFSSFCHFRAVYQGILRWNNFILCIKTLTLIHNYDNLMQNMIMTSLKWWRFLPVLLFSLSSEFLLCFQKNNNRISLLHSV